MVIYKTAEMYECNLNFMIMNLYFQFNLIDTEIFKNRDT
jgi:predicted transcriptional regulator